MLAVKAGVTKTAPEKATFVKAASLYQVNTGFVTVVELAVNTAEEAAQAFVFPLMITSVVVARGLTFTVTT